MATTLYTWGTPNGEKPLILLEELGIPYDLVKVDLRRNQQKEPAFLAVNPNGRIPALVDDGQRVFESGAVLLHLAEKHGRFLPGDAQGRLDALSWLFWQMGGIGPMFGQAYHFKHLKSPISYATERYVDESKRLLGVMEARLGQVPHLAGEYSVADMATWPWVRNAPSIGIDLGAYPNTQRWLAEIGARPAVARAMAVRFP